MVHIRTSQFLAPLSVFILSLSSSFALDSDVSKVAKKCCPTSAFECCYNAINFHVRLSCTEIAQGEERKDAMRCIQKELFGEKDVNKTSIDHLDCCDAFENDFTDPNGYCYEACVFALNAPSRSSKDKMKYIKECRRKNNLNQCFNQCRAKQNDLREKGLPIPQYKAVESDECARYKMREDEIYIVNLLP